MLRTLFTRTPEDERLTLLQRSVCTAFLGGYGLAACAWYLFMPHGFPFTHMRFWMNSALPPLVVLLIAGALVALWQKRDNAPRLVVLWISFFWAAMLLMMWVVFPVSATRAWEVLALAVVVHARPAYVGWKGGRYRPVHLPLVIVPPVLPALLVLLSQRAGAPDTRPLNASLSGFLFSPPNQEAGRTPLGPDTWVEPHAKEVYWKHGHTRLTVRPLLEFDSVSPDRFWSVFAPHPEEGANLKQPLVAVNLEVNALAVYYAPEGWAHHVLPCDARIRVVCDPETDGIRIEALTRVSEGPQFHKDVYSHLNHFCMMTVQGQETLSLSFSPCAEERIEILPSDYPVGRPARAAYMTEDGFFRVVEAASGEKGPFHLLAEGRLRRGEPLAITFYDGDKTACRVTLEDWSAQAGTALSPTAGWGFPVNAIEFFLADESMPPRAFVYVTLAATSAGRGWDTVGHAAGVYRNRMKVEPVR